jgi:HAD superfamily hydrolase (TIGR01509 family)
LNVKGIVLDMDGTITRFNLDYMSARRAALQELEKLNLRTPDMSDQWSLYVILGKVRAVASPEVWEKLRSTFYSLLQEMEVKAAKDVILFPGVVDTLRALRNRGLKIGLVTNNGRVGTTMTLERYNLAEFFDAVVTRDDCEQMKPDSAPIQEVLRKMHVLPKEAILVGDSPMDVMAARATGILSVAAPTGPFASERLLQEEPDFLIGSVNDVPTLLEQLNIQN